LIIFIPCPKENSKFSVVSVPPLFHMTSCTATKSNLYFANSLPTATFVTALCRYLTFRVPYFMSIFLSLGHSKRSVQVDVLCSIMQYSDFFTVRWFYPLVQPSIWMITLRQLSEDCSLYIFAIISQNRRNAFKQSLFIDTLINIMRNIKRIYRSSVMSVH